MPYGVYLPGRWRRQPQGAVQVDWGNPLARGLRACFSAGSPTHELVSRASVLGGSLSSFLASGTAGRNFSDVIFSGPLYVVSRRASSGWAQQFEMAAHVEVTTALSNDLAEGSFKHIISHNRDNLIGVGVAKVGGVLVAAHRQGALDDVTAAGFENTTVRIDGTSTITPGRVTSIFGLITWTANSADVNNQEMQVGVAGRAETSARYSRFGSSADLFEISAIGYRGAGSSPYARVYTSAYWDRRLSDAERLEYAQAPYQLLRPLRPILYSLPSAATAPTLSAATVIDVGSTSARPRVTVTFS